MSEQIPLAHDIYLSDRSHILFEKLAGISHLDDLINLSCSVLDASLYICDVRGSILAHSPIDEVQCGVWKQIIQTGQVDKQALQTLVRPSPSCDTMRPHRCGEHSCVRLSFPLKNEQNTSPDILCFFFWNRKVTYEEQCLASVLAGAFATTMQRNSLEGQSPREKQTRTLHELIDFKAGLKSYYLRSIQQTGLYDFSCAFRILCIQTSHLQQQKTEMFAFELNHRIPHAWCFEHGGFLLVIFNEQTLSVEDITRALIPYLGQQHLTACLSLPIYDLLRLRYVYEDCCSILPLAARKAPDTLLHQAEHYQCLAFLSRCQHYFSLQDYYPDSLTRLIDYDKENGRTYLNTLTAYLNNNMNANAAAKSIYMHRNTMMQQIERIEQIMGISLKDKEACLYLQLCLRIHELQET